LAEDVDVVGAVTGGPATNGGAADELEIDTDVTTAVEDRAGASADAAAVTLEAAICVTVTVAGAAESC